MDTYFSFSVDLTATARGTEGRAYFDRPPGSVSRWPGNAIRISSGVQLALTGAGVRIEEWNTGF